MFSKRRVCPLLAAWAAATFAAPAASDPEVERYERLADDIFDFERYDNAAMNDLIFAGLHSDNPRVVELTMVAMSSEVGWGDMRRSEDLRNAEFLEGLGRRERDPSAVPGIKDFLIDYAEAGLAEHGWTTPGDDEEKKLWKLAPRLLSRYFPGDPGVRRLMRTGLAHGPHHSKTKSYLLHLLNVGLFIDDEADALRLAMLADPNPTTVGSAAHGLALGGSKVGLEAMGRNLWRRDEALGEIVTAMASYGARAAPHMAALRELGPKERKSLANSQPVALRVAEQVERLAAAPAFDHPRSPASSTPGADARAVEVDDRNVPLVTNGYGEQAPLDHALQLYNSFLKGDILDAAFAGLHSANPAVVEQTVVAIGFYANIVAQRNWPHYAPARGEELIEVMDPRTRRLAKMPGLRGFLLSYAKRGLNPAACRERGRQRSPEQPPWMRAVTALTLYFPGNPEVRDLVLDMGRCLDDAKVEQSILPLLAIGRFRGEAVERWRIAKLAQAEPMKAGWAARGLGWSQTEAGLEALAAHLSRRDEALAEVVDAIACYGGRAAPHLPALQALATHADDLPDAARKRIASATDKVAKLAALRQEKLGDQTPL